MSEDKRLQYIFNPKKNTLQYFYFFHIEKYLQTRYKRTICRKCNCAFQNRFINFFDSEMSVELECFRGHRVNRKSIALKIAPIRFYKLVINKDDIFGIIGKKKVNDRFLEIEVPIRKLANMVARDYKYPADELFQLSYIFWHRFDSTYDESSGVPYKTYILRMLYAYLKYYISDKFKHSSKEVELEYANDSDLESTYFKDFSKKKYAKQLNSYIKTMDYDQRKIITLLKFGINLKNIAFLTRKNTSFIKKAINDIGKSIKKQDFFNLIKY